MRNTIPVLNMGVALLVFLAFGGAAAVPDVGRSGVRHPNLLLNQTELEQINVRTTSVGKSRFVF